MFNLLTPASALLLYFAPAFYVQMPATAATQQPQPEQHKPADQPGAQPLPVLREYRGVKLGMSQAETRSVLGKTSQTGKDWDEFKLGDGNLMTVRYDDQSVVKTIQLYFSDPKRAPSWAEVVGQAQIEEKPDGSKYARAENRDENFWVTMFQNKTGGVTTITLSR